MLSPVRRRQHQPHRSKELPSPPGPASRPATGRWSITPAPWTSDPDAQATDAVQRQIRATPPSPTVSGATVRSTRDVQAPGPARYQRHTSTVGHDGRPCFAPAAHDSVLLPRGKGDYCRTARPGAPRLFQPHPRGSVSLPQGWPDLSLILLISHLCLSRSLISSCFVIRLVDCLLSNIYKFVGFDSIQSCDVGLIVNLKTAEDVGED